MSTLFYFPSSWAAVGSTAWTAIWTGTASATRHQLWRDKYNSGYSVHSLSESTANSVAANWLFRQYISEQISGSQFINGYIRGVGPWRESSTSQNAYLAMRVFVVDSAMAVRGTIYTTNNSGTGTEAPTSLTNRYMPASWAVTSLTTQNGDRLVVEIGYYPRNTTATVYYAQRWFGTPANDCAYNETTVASNAPWIELQSTLMFQGGRSNVDDVGISENVVRYGIINAIKKTVVEAVDIADGMLRSIVFNRITSEIVGISEASLRFFSTAYVKVVTEAIGLAENAIRLLGEAPTYYTDDFNRADENPLAGNWTAITSMTGVIQLISNAVKDTSVAVAGVYWNANTVADDQYSKMKITTASSLNHSYVACRIQDTARTWYGLNNSKVAWRFMKEVTGTFTTIGAQQSKTIADGTVIRLDVSGTTLTAYFDGTPDAYTQTDASIASGRVGFAIQNTAVVQDDWEGGSIGAGGALKKIIIEAVSIAEGAIKAIQYSRMTSEVLSVIEGSIKSLRMSRAKSELVGILDASIKSMAMSRIVSEAVNIYDLAVRNLTAVGIVIKKIAVETVSIAENSAKRIRYNRIVGEIISVLDVSRKSLRYSRIKTEVVGILDASLRSKAMSRVVAEIISIYDLAVRKLSISAGIKKVLVEAVSITEASRKALRYSRILSEVVGMTEAARKSLRYSRRTSELVGIYDSSSRLMRMSRIISEIVGITDRSLRYAVHLIKKTTVESIAIAENAKGVVAIALTIIIDSTIRVFHIDTVVRKFRLDTFARRFTKYIEDNVFRRR